MATPTYREPGRGDAWANPERTGTQHDADDMQHRVKEKAAQAADQARQQAVTQLAGQKDRAAEQLGSVSSALRETSSNLRREQQDALAGIMDDAARQVDRLSGYLRHHTVGELLDQSRRFARRDPAIFLGGAALLGFFGARFFKSSAPDRGYDGYGTPPFEPRTAGAERYGVREVYRQPSRSGPPEYDTVHGTAGAEMPRPTDRPAGTNPATGPSERTSAGISERTSPDVERETWRRDI